MTKNAGKMKSEFVFGKEYENKYHAVGDWLLGYSHVEKLLGKIHGKTILDFGCGTGKFSRRLRDLGAKVIAVDKEKSSIESAKERGVGIRYEVIDNGDLFFIKPQSVDCAVSTFAFCQIKYKKDLQRITKQIAQKLKPNGCFIILDPNPEGLGYEFVSGGRENLPNIKFGTPIKVWLTGLDKEFYDYWKSKQDYIELMENAGLFINKIKEPKGDQDDDFWKDEKVQSPFIIIRGIRK